MIGGVFGQASIPSTSSAYTQQLSVAGYTGFNETKLAMMFSVPVDVTVSRLLGFRMEPAIYMTDFAPRQRRIRVRQSAPVELPVERRTGLPSRSRQITIQHLQSL